MPSTHLACPECQSRLQNTQGLPPETNVRCPRCGHVFRLHEASDPDAEVPEPDPLPAPRPRPTADRPSDYAGIPMAAPATDREEDDDNRYRRRDADDDDLPYERPRRRRRRGKRGLDGVDSDTSIEMEHWFRLAGAHYSDVMWPMIGFAILAFMIGSAIGMLPFGNLIHILCVNPMLQAGVAIVAMRQLRGEPWTFGDFFSGFQKFLELFVNELIIFGLTLLIMIPPGVVFVIAIVTAGNDPPDPALLIAGLGILIVTGLIGGYFIFRLTCFNVALIVDRDCTVGEAISGSWALTGKHFWGLIGMALLMGLINFGGLLLCLVGALFTMPYTTMIWYAGYLLLAGSRPPVDRPRRPDEEV